MWVAAAGMAMSFVGGLMGSSAAKRAAEQARLAGKMNAAIIALQTRENLQRLRIQTNRLVGDQRIAYAKGGVMSSFGSGADVLRDTAISGRQDELWLKYESDLRQRAAKLGAQNLASNYEAQGTAAMFNGLSGAMNIAANQWG